MQLVKMTNKKGKEVTRQLLTEQEKTQLFKDHLELAHKMAATNADKFRVPYWEMVDEAERHLGFTIAEWANPDGPGYDPMPRNGRITSVASWVYMALYFEFQTLARKRQAKPARSFSTLSTEDNPFDAPDKNKSWSEAFLGDLGEDARILVNTIVSAPAEIVGDINVRLGEGNRPRIVNYLIKHKGWSDERVVRAWDEVGECLHQA